MDATRPAVTSEVTMPADAAPHATDETDAGEVRRTLAGDRDAFGRLYDRHALGVRATVAAVSGDFTAVEDLTQEAFVRAYTRLASLRDARRFRPWLLGIARRAALERRRALARDPRTALDLVGLVSVEASEPQLDVLDEARHALDELAKLPERERLAIHAYYFAEKRADAAAKGLGLSRSGFYATLDRAMGRLRRRLGVSERTTSTGDRS